MKEAEHRSLYRHPAGTSLCLSLASVFVAQAAGLDLTLGQQLLMMLTLMLTSKGVAGIPRAALVILAGTVATLVPLRASPGGAAGAVRLPSQPATLRV